MPIRPPVKAALRKDLLLGGGAGALVCAVIAGAVLGIGPLLGIDWNGNSNGADAGAQAVALPAIPATSPQAADALRRRAHSPRVVARIDQPTTVTARRRGAAPATGGSRSTAAPKVRGRTSQPTVAPHVVAPANTQDAPTVAAPDAPATAPAIAAAAAAAIPATPVTPARVAKALRLSVASVAVQNDDNGQPELRLSLAVDGAVSGATAPDNLTVRLRPQLPNDKNTAVGPLALRAHVDVVDAPADGGSGSSNPTGSDSGAVQVPSLQVRVRMALEPAATADPASAPTVADAGDGDGQSNVIALSVPLAAFSGDDQPQPDDPAPADPSTPAAPAQPTEIRLDLTPKTGSDDPRPEAETANVPAPEAPAGEPNDAADVPVTVVVDPTPPGPAAPAPAPADPAPADPAPAAPAPAERAPADPPKPDYPAADAAPAVTASSTDATPAPAADATAATSAAPNATAADAPGAAAPASAAAPAATPGS
jgi:hypothetical protein